jgi:hypothetical protein
VPTRRDPYVGMWRMVERGAVPREMVEEIIAADDAYIAELERELRRLMEEASAGVMKARSRDGT